MTQSCQEKVKQGSKAGMGNQLCKVAAKLPAGWRLDISIVCNYLLDLTITTLTVGNLPISRGKAPIFKDITAGPLLGAGCLKAL